jgi:hypothetical protein
MARVADYSIIADDWVVEAQQDTIYFDVPSTIDDVSPGVLGFMLHTHNLDDMTLSLRLNGVKVWEYFFPDGDRLQFYQEVIDPGVVVSGPNVFSFESSSGDYRLIRLSDIVLWWQANISNGRKNE